MTGETSLGSICAVVVTYNIGNAYESCFKSLKGQVDRVVAVNTSTDNGATARFLKKLALENPDFLDVIECPENNLGLAQNLGIEKALFAGFDWILLLDHDSRLLPGMVGAMELAWKPRPERDKIAIIAPAHLDPDFNLRPHYLQIYQKYWFKQITFSLGHSVLDNITCVPASGSLISTRALRETGIRMDENFVIDNIDTDFCLKLREQGFRIIAAQNARLEHKVGNRKQHKVLGLNISCTHHAPIRRYYLNRNRIFLWQRHSASAPGFLIFDLMRLVYEMWRILLLEQDKHEKIRQVMSGLWDGISGHQGAKAGTDLTRTDEDRDQA